MTEQDIPNKDWAREGFRRPLEVDLHIQVVNKILDPMLTERYGTDLADSALSVLEFNGREKDDQLIFRGEDVSAEEVRTIFSEAIINGLTSQPEDSREEWVRGLVSDLDAVRYPNPPYETESLGRYPSRNARINQ